MGPKELIELPTQIETDRLVIRPMMPGDGKILNEAVIESWDDLKNWMPWAQHEKPSVDDSEVLCRQGYARWILRDDLWMGFWEKETGIYAGGSGLHRINWKVPLFEIGYWCRTSMQGKGYVTEVSNALSRLAFDKLCCRRLEIRCDSRNEKSEAVMKRLGFKHEATLQKENVHSGDGDLRDTLLYVRFDAQDLPALNVSFS